jgi:hypothetical protein
MGPVSNNTAFSVRIFHRMVCMAATKKNPDLGVWDFYDPDLLTIFIGIPFPAHPTKKGAPGERLLTL